jgi:hypothetical protein
MTKKKASADKAIRDIRRATRRQYSAEEKIRIVLGTCITAGRRSFWRPARSVWPVILHAKRTPMKSKGCAAKRHN